MRFWFGGPRIFGIRPGISFSPSDFSPRQQPRQQQRRQTSEKMEGGFVYVIKDEAGRVKIGSTTDPSRRLAELQIGHPEKLSFEFIGACNVSGASIERATHKLLADHSLSNEWFDVSPELAASALMGAAAKLGHKMKAIDEPMANAVIQIAALGGLEKLDEIEAQMKIRPPWGIWNVLGFVFCTVLYYIPLLILVVTWNGTRLKSEQFTTGEFNVVYILLIIISAMCAYSSARPKQY